MNFTDRLSWVGQQMLQHRSVYDWCIELAWLAAIVLSSHNDHSFVASSLALFYSFRKLIEIGYYYRVCDVIRLNPGSSQPIYVTHKNVLLSMLEDQHTAMQIFNGADSLPVFMMPSGLMILAFEPMTIGQLNSILHKIPNESWSKRLRMTRPVRGTVSPDGSFYLDKTDPNYQYL